MPGKANPKSNKSIAEEKDDLEKRYVSLERDDVDKVAKRCLAAIENITGLKHLSFKPVSIANSRKNQLELSGQGTDRSTVEGQEHSVALLLAIRPADKDPGPRYWVAVKLEYMPGPGKREFSLLSIQLFIFQSILATAEDKQPLLRIEWDCREGYMVDTHAQPHWHVYSSQLNTREAYPGTDDFEPEGTVLDFNSLTESFDTDTLPRSTKDQLIWPGGVRFHFALAADWQKPITSRSEQNHELKIDQIGNWIERCLTYVKDQLIYIDEKTLFHKKSQGLTSEPEVG